jgi:4-alpha-glucanotransferase
MLQRSAGILIPLFSLRTADDLGRGEIMQMRAMIDFALTLGHRVIQLLPLDETAPSEASPYAALTLYALDPLYISANELPGIGKTAMRRARKEAGDPARRIPRERYVALKKELLERAFEAFASRGRVRDRGALDAFIEENSYWIHDYALFRALKDHFGFRSWDEWPPNLAHREQGALAEARRELAQSIHKYCYFQYLAHQQWKQVRDYAKERGVYIGGDLAFSPGRDSDAVWTHQNDFDLTRTIGTPSDAFSETGQRWGLPMPNWPLMHEQGYRFMRMRVRRARQLYDLLRIDHVVGLYRTFSFALTPDAKGEFYPPEEPAQLVHGEQVISAILQEAGEMAIIAEDLGKVPPFVRKSLSRFGIPGYKVMRWEKDWESPHPRYLRPAEYGEVSLATSGTHDTEPLVEWWRELPVKERREFVEDLQLEGLDWHIVQLGEHDIDIIQSSLYGAPSRYAFIPIQDAFGWDARINTPGTLSDTNWTWRLPFELEKALNDPAIVARAKAFKAIAVRTSRDS